MARRLEIVVVGCGAVVDRLYRGPLARLESRGIARVTGFVDPDLRRAAALGAQFRSARAFATPADAFAEATPDLTIVASPPALHAKHATEALGAGSSVLCEKPMATRAAEAEAMLAASRDAGRVLAIGMARRMYPSLAEARALLAEGVCGDRVRFVYREGHVYSWPVQTAAPFRRATAGGGVLTDFGSHAIDLLAALFGTPAVRAYADDAVGDGVETNCRIELDFPAAAGIAQLSWNQPLAGGLVISGSEGELRFDPASLDTVRWRRHGGEWRTRASAMTWPSDLELEGRRETPLTYYDCIALQLVQALRAVVHRTAVPASGADGLIAVRAIDACYSRAEPLEKEWLTPSEREAAEARHWSRRTWAA